MVSAGKTLHQLYPNLFHITCMAHLIHDCAMDARNHHDEVDKLIVGVQNYIVKNKTRSNNFDNIGKTPNTSITRWSS